MSYISDVIIIYCYRLEFYLVIFFFFFNDTATTEIYTLSLLDALPIYPEVVGDHQDYRFVGGYTEVRLGARSEEHTSELQSQSNLVCRLLLEKKKNITILRPLAIKS